VFYHEGDPLGSKHVALNYIKHLAYVYCEVGNTSGNNVSVNLSFMRLSLEHNVGLKPLMFIVGFENKHRSCSDNYRLVMDRPLFASVFENLRYASGRTAFFFRYLVNFAHTVKCGKQHT
jgi:hypothetical protein